jgi:transposase
MQKPHRYDQEFKSGAIDLANRSDKPVAQIAGDLGIKPGLLYSWLKENRKPKEVAAAMAHLQTQEAEIKALKRELKRVKEERDILKKATAYFAKTHE